MGDVGYSGVANYANTTLGNALSLSAGNFQQVRGVGADGVAASPNYVRDALRVLASYGTNAHVYLPGIGTINGLTAGNYLLADGSTGATPVDGLMGLMLDGAGSVGSELVPNGDFSSATGWSLTQPTAGSTAITGGALVINTTDGSLAKATNDLVTLTAGSTYYVTATVTITSGTSGIAFGAGNFVTATASGTLSGYFVASTTVLEIKRATAATAVNATIDNVSVKQVTGTHATASGAARPTLRRGAYNLALQSNAVNTASWTKNGTASAPTANTVNLPADGTDFLSNTPAYTTVSGAPYTVAAILSGSGTVRIGSNSSGVTSTIVTLTATPTLYVHNFTAGGVLAFALPVYRSGTTATSVTIDGIGFFQGTYTSAQILAEGGIPITTTAAASNATAGRYSAQYSGAQSLALGSAPFTMSDSFFICAGASWDTTAAGDRPIIGFRSGTAMIRIGASSNSLDGFLRDDASTLSRIFVSGQVFAGTPLVFGFSREGAVNTLYKNDTQIGTDSTVLGTSTITAWNIGKDNAGAVFHTGTTGPIVLINGALTRAEKTTISRFIASLTPNGPSF